MTRKPACDLTPSERAAAAVYLVTERDGEVRYVNGVTGNDMAADALVSVPDEVAS